MSVHKATPLNDTTDGVATCMHCGQTIRIVPGGHGPVWVHADSGAVVGGDTPLTCVYCNGVFVHEPDCVNVPDDALVRTPSRKVWVVNLPDGVTVSRGGQVMIEQFDDQAPSIAFRSDRWYVWGPPLKSEKDAS